MNVICIRKSWDGFRDEFPKLVQVVARLEKTSNWNSQFAAAPPPEIWCRIVGDNKDCKRVTPIRVVERLGFVKIEETYKVEKKLVKNR